MPTIQLSCGAVHYLDEGAGTPLVLLHANPGDARDFSAVLPALARRFRVLALDWPGYGRSAIPPRPQEWSALTFHGILWEWLQALQLAPAFFLGNSLGGNAAARLAVEHPQAVRGLVLVSPGGFTPHNVLTRSFCRWMGSRWGLSPRRWAGLYLRRRTPVTRAMLERASGEQAEPARLQLNRAVWRSFASPEHDLRVRARRIQAPTLLIFGRHDPAIQPRTDGRAAALALPAAELHVLPCGHAPFAEIPDLFLDRVLPFLQRCESQADHAAGAGVRPLRVAP